MVLKYFKKDSIYLLGTEFCINLEKVLSIREDRRKVYRDSFLLENSDQLLAIIEGKLKRYKVLNDIDNLSAQQKIKKKDEIMDITNYLVFLLCILNNEDKDNE